MTNREKWEEDLKNYYTMKDCLEFEIKSLQKEKLRKKKDLKFLKKDITKLERRIYGR